MSRKLEDKFYLNFNNGWFETTAVWNDIGSSTGIFEQLNGRRPGAVVVFPDANGKHGHIGIVLDDGTIAHCSKGHDSNHGDAILADDGVVFNGPKSRVGWLVGLT